METAPRGETTPAQGSAGSERFYPLSNPSNEQK